MRQLYFLAAFLLSVFSSNATAVISEDWSGCHDGSLPTGWITYGTDKTPAGIANTYFSKGEGFKTMKLTEGSSKMYAVSYSSTVEGGNVSTMLVTPELRIPEAGGILEFTAANFNPEGSSANKITVRISEDGADSSDFYTVLLTKRIQSNSYAEPETYSVSLSDYAGKDVRLAFVNEGNDAGLLGLTDIRIADYFAQILDYTPMLWQEGEDVVFDIDLLITAQCRGFKATLTSDRGYSESLSTTALLDGSSILVRLQFPDHPALKAGEIMNYSVDIEPNIPGASPTTLNAATGCAEGFPAVLVEEEATGEKCGYCPAGAAGLEKFADEFGDRFVGIGIHCTSTFSTGVMENHDYSDPFLNDRNFEIVGLPSAVFNRKRLVSPTAFNQIQEEAEAMANARSAAQVCVDKVECDFDSGECRVDFTTQLALPFSHADISAAAVVIADSLKGFGPKWFQTDYFSGTSKEAFLKDADESWWPYMKFYCEYPSKNISPTDMAFNHVGMGIYPDYNGNGCILPSDWSDGGPKSATIAFQMPLQQEANEFGVQDINNTSIAVLIFNHASGEILTATKVHAADFNKDLSSVDYIRPTEAITISTPEPGLLSVSAQEDGHVDIYSFDGRHILTQHLRRGTNNITVPSAGLYIVSAHTPSAVVSKKISFLK